MAPPSRFGGGPPAMPPYQHQFPQHAPTHASHQQTSLANPPFLTQQLSPFATNGLGLAGGMGAAASSFQVGEQTGFASQAARAGFQQATALQQQQQQQQQHPHQQSHNQPGDRAARAAGGAKGRIRDVWRHNFEEEMILLMDLAEDYPYIAMDTEFPGIVGRPMGNFRGKSDYHYQCLRVNVDMLKVIQIGISLFNEKGETPADNAHNNPLNDAGPGARRQAQSQIPLAWQFNFKFALKDEMYNQASIESLQQAGIDFNLLERDGIDPRKFAALFVVSGFVCFDSIKWLSFHGGYDFGYLTKLLSDTKLANDESEFDKVMKKWFPQTYDVKHLMKYAVKLHNSGILTPTDPSTTEILQKFEQKSGLESIAEALKIKRLGAAHQAGSDSLLTGKVFFQLREKIYNGDISEDHIGKIWGLGFSGMEMPLQQPVNTDNTPPGGTNGSNTNGGPSTPSTASVGLASTPAAQSHNTNGMGPMTPGGGGGVFGQFNFPSNPR
ncbi:CAF1-domain-containing protein [Xylaria bambusicola]|uniref:CAF1-domain-containing protein n=1 Tax=Xylaria bambusicola TaxID=326684 RepID=UPI002007454D|nr:CAF1-domain-containing protein [Xylaria bambusicola]KAI0527917.1 CAF1-domain-containing protein [Xylaria bambusicola]